MHEYSIIQSLVDSVENAWRTAAPGCPDSGGPLSTTSSVKTVVVRIGDMAGVDCELLATAFEVFREGTVCEHADMMIERVPASWRCPTCNGEIPRGAMLRCIPCNQPARLATGDEIVLQRIELEVA